MIRLRVSQAVEEFRASFQRWLADHPPPRVDLHSGLDAFVASGRKWQATLASDRWIAVHWPQQYGGRGLSLVEEAVVQEELVRVNAPQLLGLFGLTMVGPVLIQHGSDEQKKRFLPKILSAQEVWCQGFSEPGAGSDLAAIKTKAQVTDTEFILSGQKIWTSFAQVAEWCFVLCRTSEEKQKHHGLSYILVNMKSPGITTRPLKQMSGDEEFNEVFFDSVRVPKENVVGRVGDGWKIAISTLMYERVVLTFARQLQSEVTLQDLITRCAKLPDTDPHRLAVAREIATTCAVRALAYDHLVEYAGGKAPGPEGSLDKLFWSESFQSIVKLALKMNGPDGVIPSADLHRYLYSRGRTIAAGTSEIQRSIIAERVLGLPRLNYGYTDL